jgi:hypothetical protein
VNYQNGTRRTAMSDTAQIAGAGVILLLMYLAYRQLFSKKLYIPQTRIFRAVWFMVLALIVGEAIF